MLAKDPDFGAFETATINSVTQGGFVYNCYQACSSKALVSQLDTSTSNRDFKFYGTDTENVSESNAIMSLQVLDMTLDIGTTQKQR